ncbi:MAG: acyltransferase [Candidatus Hydrogenedentes bacterium]|nr:acyltransferase [Candidatus Hydrogenedentota bacterium]
MRLPPFLVRIRSGLAQAIAFLLRIIEPVSLRLRRFCYEVWARSLLRGTVSPGVQFVGLITVEGTGQVSIGAGSRIGRRTFFETYGHGAIRLGERVTINDGVTIVAYAEVVLGDDTMVGEYTSIRDANHGKAPGVPVRVQPHESAPVRIGQDVWIGRGVLVGKGVTIGDGAVVGANSVVTKPVAAQVIVAGVPARVIGERR